jgi:uroporphyrinogen decarboxylase
MNNRHRVLTALSHKQPDKVPYDIRFTQKAHARMAQYYGDPDFASKLGNCFTWIRPYSGAESFVEVRPDVWRDEFGVLWDRRIDKDIGVVCNRLVTPDNVNDFEFPDASNPAKYDIIDETIKATEGGVFLVSLGFSLFERAWTLAGMENVLMAMAADKDFANTLLDRILDFNLTIIENVCSRNIDIFRFGDDWGHQRGLLMGPVLWREFIKPRFKKMCRLVKSKGKFVMLHCCGKVDEIFGELIECGLDIFNPFQPEVIDVFEAKKTYGNKMSFYGGISIQRTLPFGTPVQVREEVKKLIDIVGKNGGYIASGSHDIPADAKPENVAAMIEVLQNQ